MVRRDVERLEVPPVVFDLRPFEDLEPEPVEDLAQLALDGERGMEVPNPNRQSRRGQVDPLARQPVLQIAGVERRRASRNRILNLATHLVGQRSNGRPLGCVQAA